VVKKKPSGKEKMIQDLIQKRKMEKEANEKRARDFAKEPREFLKVCFDKLNIWEEGALLAMDKLQRMRTSKKLNKNQKALLKKAEEEFMKSHWMDVPKNPSYDQALENFLNSLSTVKTPR